MNSTEALAGSGLLAALRDATRASHARLDQSLDVGPTWTRERYAAFLLASLDVLDELEPAIERWRPGEGPARRVRLRHDLAGLGASVPGARAARSFDDADQVTGVTYVLEGSALGGRVIARRVEAALGPVPTSYLAPADAEATGARWRRFVVELEQDGAAATASGRARACAAACATFERFLAAFAAAGLLAVSP